MLFPNLLSQWEPFLHWYVHFLHVKECSMCGEMLPTTTVYFDSIKEN